MLPVDKADLEAGYAFSEGLARVSTELGLAALTGVAQGSKLAYVAKGANYFDTLGNVVGVGRGGYDAYTNDGFSLQNSVQMIAGLFGLGGNTASFRAAGKVDETATTLAGPFKEIAGSRSVVGGARVAPGITGLHDVKDFVPSRLQKLDGTCGLYCASNAMKDLNVPHTLTVPLALRNSMRSGGLNRSELTTLINNSTDAAFAVSLRPSLDDFYKAQTMGSVIAHVDGNHWVNVNTAFSEISTRKTWVNVTDSARGTYNQLETSFHTRMAGSNTIINVRPY
ncbi:MAG: hypothetical protein SFX18_14735 [Pirellulales bacterium]|nr:hypothetical protein [Pirellulales bacterium]